jgi:hypothetical protein
VTAAQQTAGQPQAPLRQVLARRQADDGAETRREAGARHAGLTRHRVQRPGAGRLGMHGGQRPGQALVRQPTHQPAVDQSLGDGMAQQLHHQHFGQAVDDATMPAAAAEGLVEQQLLRQRESRHPHQRRHQPRRQVAQQRVLVAGPEADVRADDVGILLGVKLVRHRAGIEDRRRLLQHHRRTAGVGQGQPTLAQQVQLGAGRRGVQGAAEGTRPEHLGAEIEALQQRGQPVEGHG